MPLAKPSVLLPEMGSKSRVQYVAAGFVAWNSPVTCSEIGVPAGWVVPFSTEPTVRCSWLATAAGSATGTGSPGPGGPGHCPAVSVAWALIPSIDAGWICVMAVFSPPKGLPCGLVVLVTDA